MTASRTYLQRYVAGEHEPVWAELVALGAAAYDEPVHSDAVAVARETMRRARANIETLIPCLQRLGYTFGYNWLDPDMQASMTNYPALFTAPGPDVQEQLGELERWADGIPLSIRAWYEVIGEVNFFGIAPLHWPLPPWRERLQHYWEAHPGYSAVIFAQSRREQEADWADFEAACQEFITTHPQYPEYTPEEMRQFAPARPRFLQQICSVGAWLDPLQVFSVAHQLSTEERTAYQEWWAATGSAAFPHADIGDAADIDALAEAVEAMLARGEAGDAPECPRAIIIGADALNKYHISGGGPYQIILPCRAADAPLAEEPHQTTFVNYLRLCFRWGGFPGFGAYSHLPQADLARLREGLLPL